LAAMDVELPIPGQVDLERVGEVWRVEYETRAREAREWASVHRIGPAARDERRVCLLAVDVQNTFCTPGFELFVAGRSGTGAVDDSRRLCSFVYRNLAAITEMVVTLDTHQAFQIFHAPFLIGPDGSRPDPYTLVSEADVAAGTWSIDREAAEALGVDAARAAEHLRHYVATLASGGKYELTIWPFHAMLGGLGHALVSALEEAFFFHAIAREAPTRFEIKGFAPLTEHYSALGPEVLRGSRGELIGERNATLVEHLRSFDAVMVAGQAKSHCVAWTVQDLLEDEPELARTLYLLEDCTSAVVVPDAVDYTEDADRAFAGFAERGVKIVRSTERLSTWI
jgi:nicotinamidase-related amidase